MKWDIHKLLTDKPEIQARGCYGRQEGKDCFFTVNTSTAAQITEGSQQQPHPYAPGHDWYTYYQCLLLISTPKLPKSGFLLSLLLLLLNFKQIWGKNEKRKIKRPMWKFYESYTYRSRGWSDTHGTWKMTLQHAVCIPPANWSVKSDAFFMKHPYDSRTSLHKTTCNTKSSEDTGLIL